MFCQNDYIMTNIRKQQIAEYRQEAAHHFLLAQLKSCRPNPLLSVARGMLHGLGHLLLAVGRRMDRIAVPSLPVASMAPGE